MPALGVRRPRQETVYFVVNEWKERLISWETFDIRDLAIEAAKKRLMSNQDMVLVLEKGPGEMSARCIRRVYQKTVVCVDDAGEKKY